MFRTLTRSLTNSMAQKTVKFLKYSKKNNHANRQSKTKINQKINGTAGFSTYCCLQMLH